ARRLSAWPAAQAHFAMWPTWLTLVGLFAALVAGAAAWRGARWLAFIAVAAFIVRGWQCDWPNLSGTNRLYLFGPPANGSLLVRTSSGDDLLFAKARTPEALGQALGAIGVRRLRLVVVLGGGVESWRRALGGAGRAALWLGSGEELPIHNFAPGSEVSRGAWRVRALGAGNETAFSLRVGDVTMLIAPRLSVNAQRALAQDWSEKVDIVWFKGTGAEPVFWPWLAGLRPEWLVLQGSPGHPVNSETLTEASRFAANTTIRQEGWAEFDLRSGRITAHR
ncbi:MAG TPA: hypothetical protein VFK80_09020, partial [Limnochordia bacterium]|nr:hypothetical protein [Limnochordia bacterium]